MKTARMTRWAAYAALAIPSLLTAQMRVEVALISPGPVVAVSRCGSGPAGPYAIVWEELNETAELDREVAKRTLATLEDSLAAVAPAHPSDVELQYALAAVIGARAEVEGGLDQVEAAKAAHAHARAVLELDPDHPGAQHILGRLHLEVLRMGRVKRFLATRVLGGSELSGASWDVARRLLVAGAVGDPCSLDHHYHLARLYAEVGDEDMAMERLDFLLDRAPRNARDRAVAARAAELRARLGGSVEASR